MTITTELLRIKKKLFFVPSRAMTRGPRPTTSAQHQRCSPSRQSSFTRHDIFSQLVHLSWVSSCEASLNLTFSLTYISPSVGLLVWSASIGLFDLSLPATTTLLIITVWFIQSLIHIAKQPLYKLLHPSFRQSVHPFNFSFIIQP